MKIVISFLVFFNFLVLQVFSAMMENKDENGANNVVSLSRTCDSEAEELNSFEENEKTCQETQTEESEKPKETEESEESKETNFEKSKLRLNGDVTRCNESDEQNAGCFGCCLGKKKKSSRKIEVNPMK